MDVKAVKTAGSDSIIMIVAIFALTYGMEELQSAVTDMDRIIGLAAIGIGGALFAVNSYFKNKSPSW